MALPAPQLLTDEQLYQMTGSWTEAARLRDEQNRALNIYNDAQRLYAASGAAPATQASAIAGEVDPTKTGQYVQDPVTGKYVALSAYSAGFDPNNPITQTYLGELAAKGGTDTTSQLFNMMGASQAQKDANAAAWAKELARLQEIDRQNASMQTNTVNTQAQGLLDTKSAASNAQSQAPKTYSAVETALYNAYRAGNMAEVNRLLAANKLTGADVKSAFGLTDADIAWITNNAGGKFYSPTTTGTTTKTTTGTGTVSNVINTIAGGKTPTGQFRELFPSFEESKRLAAQTIASRPTTQQLVNMISNPQNPALTTAWQNAEKTGNYGDVAGMLQNMPLGKVQSAYGLSNADMQYIMSRPEIATALSKSGMVATPAPTLTNVLGMISK